MANKLSFNEVSEQVDSLYSQPLIEDETVYDRIDVIVNYLSSVGWSEEEFEQYLLFGGLN